MGLEYDVPTNICRNAFPNLPKTRNLEAISVIPIPEYSQPNATHSFENDKPYIYSLAFIQLSYIKW